MAKKQPKKSNVINKKPPDDPNILETQEDVAKVFGVSVRSVGYWVRDGMPVRNDGTYDIRDIKEWKINKTNGSSEDEQTRRLKAAQAEEREYKAKIAELELKRLQNELIPRDVVEQGLIDASTVIKRSLLSMPREIVPKLLGLNPKQIELKLMDRVKQIIQSFADETAFLTQDAHGSKKIKTKNLD